MNDEGNPNPPGDAAPRSGEAWLSGQEEAFRAAVQGAPLEESLGSLARAAVDALGEGTRAAFYISADGGETLRHVVGMGAGHAEVVDGAWTWPKCLDTALGEPIVTADVRVDPRRDPWRGMAERFGYRGCWSFPIHGASGAFVGTFAVYTRLPREATPRDLELASLTTAAAGIIISRHAESEARQRAEKELARELEGTKLLQAVCGQLVQGRGAEVLYEQILDAAVSLMHADMGSIHLLDAERGELRLLACRGFDPESAAYWARVTPESACTSGGVLRTGERLVVPDVNDWAPARGMEDLEKYHRSGVTAAQSTPLVTRAGRPVGMISTHWRGRHEPGERELRLLDVLARQAADALERERAAAALRASEEKYRSLFASIDEGFCTFDMIFDDAGVPGDYRFVEYNPAFERHAGLKDAVGRTVREFLPDQDSHWFEIYGRVATTGEPIRVIRHGKAPNRWIEVYAFRIGAPEQRRVAALFSDVTARHEAERLLRASAERQAFLLRLSDALRPVAGPEGIKPAASRVLGEHLRVNRAFYAEMAGDDWVVSKGYEQEVIPLPDGLYSADTYGRWIMQTYRNGGRIVFRDSQGDPRFSPAERDAHAAAAIVGAVGVPLVRGGKLVAILAVHTAGPRDWTDEEIALVEETAERTWSAVERAMAEAELKASEAKYSAAFQSMDEGFCLMELIRDEAGELVDLVFRETNRAFRRQTGLTDVVGRTVREILPAFESYWIETYSRVARTGEAERVENYLRDVDRWYNVFFSLVGPVGSRFVAVLFDDITERKRREERQAFLLRLMDALRPLANPVEIRKAACRVLGEHLDVGAAQYGELDHERQVIFNVRDHHRDEVPSHVGECDMRSYPAHVEAWLAGRPLAIDDVATDPVLSDGERADLLAHSVRASLTTPLAKDGRVVAVMAALSEAPRRWNQGDVGLLEETADRTWAAVERARAEVALRDREADLARVQRIGRVGGLSIDVAGGLRSWRSPNYLRIHGIPGRAAAETHADWLARIHPDDRDDAERALSSALRSDASIYQNEYRIIRPLDGEIRWIYVRADIERAADGTPLRLVGAHVDVTELKRVQIALRESEDRLRLALAAARTGTWHWDVAADAHRRDANLNALFGLRAEETIRPFSEFLEQIHPDDRAMVRAAFDGSVRAGQPLNTEFRVTRPDGGVRWLRNRGDVFETAGQVRLAGACVDVTDLKEAEAALQRANDELEARVAERTADLKAEIERRRDLTRRLSTAQEDERRRVSRDLHDSIGQLLAGLSMAFKAVEAAGELPPLAAGKLVEAMGIVEALGKEVHGLAVRLRPTSLDDVGLESALGQLVAEWSGRTGVRADFQTAGLGPGRLTPEIETTLYRVVQEALTNVAKHARASIVSVVVSRPDEHVTAVIEDNGAGFDPDAAPTGRLGLVGMRERVALVGGEMEIEAEPGSGTTVYVRIPIPEGEGGGP